MAININDRRFARGAAFSNLDKQQSLADSTVLIAGCGGEGGPVALNLARMGVGKFILADPGNLHEEDGNRYPHWFTSTEGLNKAEVIAEMIRNIDSGIEVEVCTEGVTSENVDWLVSRADLVFDGIDIDQPEIDKLLHESSRYHRKTVVMSIAIGRGGIAVVFDPDVNLFSTSWTYEQFSRAVGFIPHVPYYENALKIASAMESPQSMKAPTSSTGTPAITAITCDLIERLLTDDGARRVKVAPSYLVLDFGGNHPVFKWVRFPRLHVLYGKIRAGIHCFFGRAPKIGGYGDLP